MVPLARSTKNSFVATKKTEGTSVVAVQNGRTPGTVMLSLLKKYPPIFSYAQNVCAGMKKSRVARATKLFHEDLGSGVISPGFRQNS